MPNLNDFVLFVHIVDRGGFSAASRALQIPKSTLSQRLMKLEQDLGVRLLNRSSRHVRLTEAGRDFYTHAAGMLREAEMAETVVRQRMAEPSGLVRYTAAPATTQFALSKMIPEFLSKFPKVRVASHATNRDVDIVGENFDLAIRAHSTPLPDSNLVQRTLVTMNWHLYAGTSYIARHGEPLTPDELHAHPTLAMTRTAQATSWRLHPVGDERDVVETALTPRLTSNDMVELQKAAINGLGITALPSYVCREAVEAGTLRCVLPDWSAGVGSLTALLPSRTQMLPSVRAFVDHLIVEMPKLAPPPNS
ncbi:LysR substrate-binding domain-containing protein [Acuticoccus sp. M5D2P5]|uniref:LysR substrate-binding domain-containing protein n=1 Tax=Acuticoccus kalidii TaxID=2910977 RepID=UPI001F3C747E|nr:LysR substrate-binding domain-containing protein [Acuticoccus kalidii]MCF3934015.1 LysR substrate-binding domain-containing protein [Acuticoccus kalidii]